jgi:hypothetical protein
MPITYAELKAMLDVDEPDYPALAELASNAQHHVRKLAASADESVASKAVSLAGIMGDADSIGIVGSASKSRHVLVRLAAAHAAGLLPDSPGATRVVSKLLDDKDVGVVKLAARAATRLSDPGLEVKARRATVRMHAAVRKIERKTAMATKAAKKASRVRASGKSKSTSGKMPPGAMTAPAKGVKTRQMPTGKMN